jgi:Zn-dependent protease with chaperone function
VNRLAGKLAQTAALRAPLTIKVISGSNAYTTVLPGGVLDVDSTLILDAMSEAEVAGVIAHQIAHLALLPSIETGELCVRCGLHSMCTAPAIPMAFLATSRDREGKADERSARIGGLLRQNRESATRGCCTGVRSGSNDA